MSMEAVRLGEEFTVKSIREKENPAVRRLCAMGLKEGIRVKLLLKNGRVYLLRLKTRSNENACLNADPPYFKG